MNPCDTCKRVFGTVSALRNHKMATRHYVCQHCNKSLASPKGLCQHLGKAHVVQPFKCPECSMLFVAKQGLTKHQRQCGHCVCGECNRSFNNDSALSEHIRNHPTEFRCCDCDRNFKNINALNQHLRHTTHRLPPSRNVPIEIARVKCARCSRKFDGEHALQQHEKSPRHRPISNVKCIASSCNKAFTTPSGLLHHLESGKCSSGMDRTALNDLVLTHDTDRLITKEGTDDVLLEANSQLQIDESDLSSEQAETMTPSSSGVFISFPSSPGILTPRSESMSLNSWPGHISQAGISCPFCPSTRLPFCNQTALNQHLQSAAHDDSIFFCPISLLDLSQNSGNNKVKAFTTVSGLSQHLESGACEGGSAALRKVAAYLEMRLRAFSINVKLVGSQAYCTKGRV